MRETRELTEERKTPGREEERRKTGRIITPEEGLRNREQLVRAIKEMQRRRRMAYGGRK